MNKTKLTDKYEDIVESSSEELEKASSEYRDGFNDGLYVFYASLLGEAE